MSDRQRSFDRIKQSAAYADRASRARYSATDASMDAGCGIAFLVLAAAGLLLILVTGGSSSMGIVTTLVFFVGIVLIHRTVQYSKAPAQAAAAIVVSKHSRGDGAFFRNHITLEFEDGQRREFRIRNEDATALIGVGDAGVAFTRLDEFLAFDRVP